MATEDEVDDVAMGVFTPLLVLVVAPMLVLMSLMWRRRRLYPLNGRDMTLVIPSQILLAFNVVVTYLRATRTPPCIGALVTDVAVPAVAICCAVCRLLRMVFLYKFALEKLTTHKASMGTDRTSSEESPRWFSDHRYMIQSSWMWKVIAPVSTFFIAAAILIYSLSSDLPTGDREDCACPRMNRVRAVQIVLYVSLLSTLIYAIRLVRKVEDGFFIKQEFIYFGASGVVTIIFNMVRAARVDIAPNFPLTEFFIFVGYSFLLGVPIAYPLYLSYSKASQQRGSSTTMKHMKSRSSAVPFAEFLIEDKYKADRQDFEQMLIKEFSVENLMFFDAAGKFERLVVNEGVPKTLSSDPTSSFCDNEAAATDKQAAVADQEASLTVAQHSLKALEIYQRYVARGAPYEVNLSHGVYEQMEREISAHFGTALVRAFCDANGEPGSYGRFENSDPIRSDVFAVARQQILKLMKADTYVRWMMKRRDESKFESPVASSGSRTDRQETHFETYFEDAHAIDV